MYIGRPVIHYGDTLILDKQDVCHHDRIKRSWHQVVFKLEDLVMARVLIESDTNNGNGGDNRY